MIPGQDGSLALYSPQTAIHRCCSSWDNFGDEDSRVIWNVGIVNTSRYAEAKAGVTLQEMKRRVFPSWATSCCRPSRSGSSSATAACAVGALTTSVVLQGAWLRGQRGARRRGGCYSSAEALGAVAQSTTQMEWESGSC